jgi:hypothetical protein
VFYFLKIKCSNESLLLKQVLIKLIPGMSSEQQTFKRKYFENEQGKFFAWFTLIHQKLQESNALGYKK